MTTFRTMLASGCFVLVVGGCLALSATAASAAEQEVVVGVFSAVHGDPAPGTGEAPVVVFHLTDDQGRTTRVSFSAEFVALHRGLEALHSRRIQVWLEPAVSEGGVRQGRAVKLLDAGDSARNRSFTGHQPFVSLLCKFADVADEPRPYSYFVDMYDNTVPRLDHYWREVSYGTMDIVGSIAVDWKVMANDRSHYIPDDSGCYNGNFADLDALFAECTAAADPFVDFSDGFVGINLMFNDDLDGCSWGGGHPAVLDGVDKTWPTTWEAPWGYENICVMAHEMGHAFDLPHSNNFEGTDDDQGSSGFPTYPYDNSWDVMSDSWNYADWDATWGTRGKHTIAYHKDRAGWIAPAEKFTVMADGTHTITIDDLALATTSNYRMAQIPIPSSSVFYVVEVRDQTGVYDSDLPGNAVLIYEVDQSRSYLDGHAWAVDEAPVGSRCGQADCESVMWRVGETFTDVAASISVEVLSATADGFTVRITSGTQAADIFADDFESGNTSAWSATTQ